MTRYLLAGAAAIALALGGGWMLERSHSRALSRSLEAARASLAAMEEASRMQARARVIANEQARAWRERADQLQDALNALTEGIEDAPLDPDLADRLNRLRDTD